MKVSIIIPIYNVEDYLVKCLDSVINQTYKDIKIILVNDGSLDNSQLIIDEYKIKDKRILALTKTNGGLSDARNYGLNYVESEYIFFLDSDDYLQNDAIELLVHSAMKYDSDLVFCDYNEIDVVVNSSKAITSNTELNGVDFNNNPNILNEMPHCAWNKLYRFSLFKDFKITFPKGLYYEDVATSPKIYLHAKKISYVKKPLINYLVNRPGNITGTISNKVLDIVQDLQIINDYYKTNDSFTLLKNELELFNIRLIYDNLWKMKYTDNIELIDSLFENSFNLLDANFTNWRNNKYFNKNSKITNLIIKNKFIYKLKSKRKW